MGYELHITRAFMIFDSERYPILDAEVDALVRAEADLADGPRQPGVRYIDWIADAGEGHHSLRFDCGKLAIKHPRPAFIRRMIELAARLDARVIGDDGLVYEWEGDQVVERERRVDASAWNQRFITRGGWAGGLNLDAPIRPAEWEALVAAQPDFETMTSIEASLPSGVRSIACPPVACWTGHPSGRPVPFFFDHDLVEVRSADEPTVRRMWELAEALDAKVVDDRS